MNRINKIHPILTALGLSESEQKKIGTSFQQQIRDARQRNIDFKFTYEEWLVWWGDDIVNRGRTKGKLVMARYKDQGCYEPTNCYKSTCGANTSYAHKGKTHYWSPEAKKAMSKTHKGRICSWLEKPFMTPQGLFKSKAEAHKQLGLDMSYYMKTRPTQYYYVKESF